MPRLLTIAMVFTGLKSFLFSFRDIVILVSEIRLLSCSICFMMVLIGNCKRHLGPLLDALVNTSL